jgi:hypothetical protein
MMKKNDPEFVCCGREITLQEIKEIQETAGLFPNLSRRELAETICEHLDWRTASGSNKIDACMKMLEKLENVEKLQLPGKQIHSKATKTKISFTSRTDPQPAIIGKLGDLNNVNLEIAKTKDSVKLWNEYVSRYHYLGYKKPFGYTMRYFIISDQGILGCILFSGASKALGVRDQWIGWTKTQRLKNLSWLINNSRFLLFPWVNVKNLVSNIWGQVSRRICNDWENQWNFSPVLMETFVDPKLYHGTSYKASNWEFLGMTTGVGLVRTGKSYKTSPKQIYMKPLVKDFRKTLCSENLKGNQEDE